MYCIYITIYSGNKLPPFYIGSSSVQKVLDGYKGTVSSKQFSTIWKQEIKNNPNLFKTFIICKVATRNEALQKEMKLHKALNVVKNPLYINKAVAAQNGFFGMDVSGENNPMFGKNFTQEHRNKISVANKGKVIPEHTKEKIRKSSVWYTNRREELLQHFSKKYSGSGNPYYGKFGKEHPKYGHRHTLETRLKQSKSLTGLQRSEEHCRRMNRVFTIESITGIVFTGYGLGKFCKLIGVAQPSFLYSLTSKKFMNGYRIKERNGMCKDMETKPLTDFLD